MNFRNYNNCSNELKQLYYNQRKNQNLKYSKYKIDNFCNFENKSTFWELFDEIQLKDISDPDISLPNYFHLYQTAEGIRKNGLPEWMQLVGLIHDMGKILYKKKCSDNEKKKYGITEDTQWGIVGDTFILGHRIPNTIIFPEYNDLKPLF